MVAPTKRQEADTGGGRAGDVMIFTGSDQDGQD